MFRPEHAIETTRLTLRSFTPGDFGDLYAYQSRPDVARYLHWEARDHVQVREALVRQCDETSLRAEGDWLTFAVVWREAGKVVGEVGLSARVMERIGMRREARSCTTRSSRVSGLTSLCTPSSIMNGADQVCQPRVHKQ
jgi:RimJ/RimL family protein N-acetyltransferase